MEHFLVDENILLDKLIVNFSNIKFDNNLVEKCKQLEKYKNVKTKVLIVKTIKDEMKEDMEKMLAMFGVGSTKMSFVKKKSICNQFYSDLATPLEERISVDGTTVHIFYARKMGEIYLERYHKHFANPCIHEHDLQHEELLISYPEKWVEEVRRATGLVS